MTLEQAILVFKKQCPARTIEGYWKDTGGYVFKVSTTLEGNAPEPNLFVVTSSGNGYFTNPMRSPIVLDSKMSKL